MKIYSFEQYNESKKLKYDSEELTSDGTELATDYLKDVILKAIENKTLAIKEGERKWKGVILSTINLVWARNNIDGYEMNIYLEDDRGVKHQIGHIVNDKIDKEYTMDNFNFDKYMLNKKYFGK
jgi:hypothetical protein